ncbi:hypothetical protein [Sphingomonas sp. Leaf21]|uniref:hypothetical protein n=1 Tax=Sphingomonas sp. Leaf21 TaxID=2876550 RepID=UPI001E5B57C9|nr:hypothetical protein [Sphingomonas sp. Leaf21]
MRILFLGATLLTVAIPAAATAQTAPTTTAEPQASPFGSAAPVDNALLGTVTGQSDLSQVIRAQNSSTVSGNSVSGHSETGTISFDQNSFQGLNGLSLLSANTGNNVSINSSLNVNVAINQ